MSKVKVNISEKNCEVKLPTGTRMLIRRSCAAVLLVENFTGNAEVNVTFVDENVIKELNREHRNIDKITDVLSFPLGENGQYDINPENGNFLLGDVVICTKRAVEQAEEYGHSLQREISFLTVHSVLHPLGYDHVDDVKKRRTMRGKEEKVMAELGVTR